MNVPNPLGQLPGGVTPRNVHDEPFVTADGATVFTVSKPSGAVVGVFVIHGGTVVWKAAVDDNPIVLVATIAGLLSAVLTTLAMLRRPPWPDIRLAQELPESRRDR